MTPRELSAAVIQRRLTMIDELLGVARDIGPVSRTRLENEPVTRLAIERILTQLVELASDVNGHIAASAGTLSATDYRSAIDACARLGVFPADLARELKLSVGLRNVLVHEYVNVDLNVVTEAAVQALGAYADYIRAVAAWLSAQR